jgi:outer membrane protein OmpA-like peptidoglycan-associated protein
MGKICRRLSFSVLIGLFLACTVPLVLQAQQVKRAEDTGYIKARVGVSNWAGDSDVAGVSATEFGAFGGEIGYQFTRSVGLGVGVLRGVYPDAVASDPTASDAQYHVQLLLNYFLTPNSTLSPYIAAGAEVAAGTVSGDLGGGPVATVGLDLSVSPRASLFAEAQMNMTFPDASSDNYAAGDYPYDNGHFLGGGLRVTFDRPFVPVEISSVEIPDRLITGEQGTFAVQSNPNATDPVDYQWTLGDGTQAEGQSISHAYEEADNYEVTVTASNAESQDSRAGTVEVFAPPEIVTMNANPTSPETGENVDFSAEVRGSEPISYSWNIDGTTLSGEAPSYTFEDAGNHTVELTAENEAGEDDASITVNVEESVPLVCRQLMSGEGDLNTVHFDFDVSELDMEAEGLLDENVSVLDQCMMVNVLLRGFADQVGPSQYNVRLSQRRAESVEEYYVNEGIDMDRLSTEGLGEAPEPCLKEDPGPGCRRNRRVESIPRSGN